MPPALSSPSPAMTRRDISRSWSGWLWERGSRTGWFFSGAVDGRRQGRTSRSRRRPGPPFLFGKLRQLRVGVHGRRPAGGSHPRGGPCRRGPGVRCRSRGGRRSCSLGPALRELLADPDPGGRDGEAAGRRGGRPAVRVGGGGGGDGSGVSTDSGGRAPGEPRLRRRAPDPVRGALLPPCRRRRRRTACG